MSDCRIVVRVGQADFDPGAELAAIGAHGAVASFIGHVRADGDAAAGVTVLTLDHHPTMTVKALQALAQSAATRWPLAAVTILHRVGPLNVGDRIVLVACASPHREAALESCTYCIDRLKTDVPLWKRETLTDGTARWVEPRDGDAARAAGWRATP